MSTVTVQQFQAAFPVFSDSNKFPEPQVQFWLDLADKVHNADRWGDVLSTGIMLYVAHHLSGDYMATKEVARGGAPGLRSGVISSEGGDNVNVSFDTTIGSEEGAGHFNTTIFGKRWFALAQLHGAGPVQVGLPSGGDVMSSAWAGPPVAWLGPW